MSNRVKDKIEEANALTKNQEYSRAIVLYEDVLKEDGSTLTGWDARNYANALRKSGNPSDAISFVKSCADQLSTNQLLKNELAWALYDKYLKGSIRKDQQCIAAAQEIIDISSPNDQYSPAKMTIFKMIKLFEDLPTPRNDEIFEWLGYLDENNLSGVESQYTSSDGTPRTGASELEKFYVAKTESLLQLGKYAECLHNIDTAQQRITKFHYDQDIWMERRKAKCLLKMEKVQEAEMILNDILARKKEWFIYKEIAEIYASAGKTGDALKYAVDGALAFGDPDKKIHLYEFMAELLRKCGDEASAKQHIELAAAVRIEKDWSISKAFEDIMASYGINLKDIDPLGAVLKKLKPFWERQKFLGKPLMQGRIKSILPNGRAGFIETSDRKSYYFKMASFRGSPKLAQPGMVVEFFLEEGYDAKKNCKSMNAINVKLCQQSE